MGMPIYPTELWLVIMMFGFTLLMLGFVMFGPFVPFAIAKISKRKLLGMIDKTGQIKFSVADIRNGMYFFGNNPMRFIKQYSGAYRIGGVDVDLVHIDRGFVMKPEFQAAIVELKEKYGVHTYIELRDKMNAGEIEEKDLLVPLFFKVPLDEMVKYGAEVPPSSITGEVDDLIQAQKTDAMAGLGKYIPWILMFAIVLIAGAIAAKIVS
jgi:hypothetical protein